jgi:DNA-binding response OmpR family regulator
MKKILLADDDASIRQALGEVLASEQYAVILAATGNEAATKFAADKPDLVLLDLSLPDRDGWEIFDCLGDTHPWVPVFIITAKSHQQPRAIGLGVDVLMEKPLNIPLLLELIRLHLAETRTDRIRRLTRPDFKPICPNEHQSSLA